IIPEGETPEFYSKISRLISSKYAINFLIYAENDAYYITRFRYKNVHKHILYDKKKQQYFLFDTFKEGFHCFPLVMDNDYAYALVDNTIRNIAINSQYLDDENRRRLDAIGEYDNQFILRFKFK
ncbi:hypothetical protein LJB80_00975, partial [Bacteroides sp. OttesenSCG-928-F21]|nr:hypothetical protein [Bacteroides sp. OttesenSCG-928-F21]